MYLLYFSKYQIYVISWVENIDIYTPVALQFWCFQHIQWNTFGIHLREVNSLCIYAWTAPNSSIAIMLDICIW